MLGGNNPVKDYTHIVTVGKSGVDWYDYGYNSEVGYGGISPSVLFPNTPVISPSIAYLYVPVVQVEDYIQTKFKFDGLRWDIYDIYIGRSDTKYVDYVISAKANETIYFDGEIFSKNDIGKQVKLWISTTPPPWYEDPNGHSGGGAQIG